MSFEEDTTEAHERRITRCKSCRAQIIWFKQLLVQTREENVKLRSKLLEIAKECQLCDGTGLMTVVGLRRGVSGEYQEPCSDCTDIREVLGQ